ncbi:MAG: hypothetical protein KAR21_05670, partial [Spirochaetales bacterium]|nr:hypothetical protein [Spirochaetales bacterium]
GLFETALVKTGAYTVFEQNQIAAVFESQKISLSGLVDKKYAVELGKLLAAEQIILGELSSIGDEYVLNVKVIDVTTGMNINADNIKTDSLSLITKQVELLAYKIAGLTYTSGDTVMIAEDFRELFVMTDPAGAAIYINGVRKGVSPDLFEQIPLGYIRIEAEKDNLYGRLDINITEEMDVVEIPLKETYGKLFIKCDIENLNVYIDGNFLDVLQTGFFTGIPVGGHDIVVGGDGYFWWGFVSVNADKVTTISIEPFEYGTFNYEILPGAEAEITGKLGYSQIVSNSGTLWLIVDDYNVKVYGKDFESEEFSYSIKFKTEYNFNPDLKYNRDYINTGFKGDIKYYSDLINTGTAVTDGHIQNLGFLKTKISDSRFQFDEL